MSFKLTEECIHFRELVICINSAESEGPDSPKLSIPQDFTRLIRSKKLISLYPNLETALRRMYITILSANTTGERSFSRLKLLKSSLRNCTSQGKLNNEAIICLNPDTVANKIKKDDVIDEFATLKARKAPL